MDIALRKELDRYLQEHLQNQVFDMDINTDYLNRSITATYADFDFGDDQKTEHNFTDLLARYIEASKYDASDIYEKTIINEARFNRSLAKKNSVPSKSKVLALGMALELSEGPMEALLASAGYELTDTLKRDLIVRFFIKQQFYEVTGINLYLKYYKEMLLGEAY